MKRTVYIVFALCILLTSCRAQEAYHFLNEMTETAEVSIVKLSFSANNLLTETEIQKIDNIKAFFNDFRSIPCYVYFGDPTGLTPEGVEATVFKIIYVNGDYELINWNGQAVYTSEKGLKYYAGFNIFDKEQFQALIAKYSLD